MTDKLDALQRDFDALSRKIAAEQEPVRRIALKAERIALSTRMVKLHQSLVKGGENVKAPLIGPPIGKPNPDFADGAEEEEDDE